MTNLLTKGAAVAAAMFIAIAGSAAVGEAQEQSKGQQKCIVTLNKCAENVFKQTGKEGQGCLKDYFKNGEYDDGETTLEGCVRADARDRIAKKRACAVKHQPKRCTGENEPDFGFTDATTLNNAAVDESIEAAYDLLGDPVESSLDDEDFFKCQERVYNSLHKLMSFAFRSFRVCKQKGLKDKTTPITDEAGLVACIAGMATDKRVLNENSKIAVNAEVACQQQAPSHFDGQCSGTVTSNDFADCVQAIGVCRACSAAEDADGLTADCDTIDDGLANGSCPN